MGSGKSKAFGAALDLVCEEASPDDDTNEWLRFPLELALAKGDVRLAQRLVDTGADTAPGYKGREGRSLLDAAADGGAIDALQLILKAENALNDLNVKSGPASVVPLMRAINGRHVDAARLLVNIGADVSARNAHLETPLHLSLMLSSPEIAEHLIAAGSDVNAQDHDHVTPAHLIMRNHFDGADNLLYILLMRGADVNAVDKDENSLVHDAARHGRVSLLQKLLDAGAKPDAKNKYGNTPLFRSVLHRDNVDIVRMLVSRSDVDVNSINQSGNTPIAQAAVPVMKKWGMRTIEVLLSKRANIEVKYKTRSGVVYPLLALARCSEDWTRFLLKHGASVTDTGSFGFNALHWAAVSGSTEVLQILGESGLAANVDDLRFGNFDKDGRLFKRGTALFLAVVHGPGRSEHIRLLLKWGADVNCKEDSGLTPLAGLCWALSAGGLEWRVEVADLLLRSGADENLANNNGEKPLDLFSSEMDPDGTLGKLLQNAHVDRVWRRRGILVMLRSFWLAGKVTKISLDGDRRTKEFRKARDEKEFLEWLMCVDEQGVFRTVVSFL